MTTHATDSDCTIDPATDCCAVCGVLHGDPCLDCGGRGFHRPDCAQVCENCTTEAYGDCPRCFAETGIGCGHGDICDNCAADPEPVCERCCKPLSEMDSGIFAPFCSRTCRRAAEHAEQAGA